jgi:hypothetical protein
VAPGTLGLPSIAAQEAGGEIEGIDLTPSVLGGSAPASNEEGPYRSSGWGSIFGLVLGIG